MPAPIALCVIARNEAGNLPRCLLSVREAVYEMVVVDTGSTDDTAAIARSLGARVVPHPWQDDFAAARNTGLAAVTAPWVLILDADEALHPQDQAALARLPAELGEAEGCSLRVISFLGATPGPEQMHDCRLSLFRSRPEYRFQGAIHEQILPAIRAARPEALLVTSPVRILHYGYLQGALAGTKRIRNRRLLAKALQQEPREPFWHYALAAEEMADDQFASALEHLAAATPGWGPAEPRHADLVRKQVICLTELGRGEQALALAEAALARYPDYTDLAFLAGAAAQRAGNPALARHWFGCCLQLGEAPVRHQSCHGVGSFRAHAALGALASAPLAAAEHFLAALQAAPDWRLAQWGLARVLVRLPPEAAHAWLSSHLDLADAATLLVLGSALLEQGADALVADLTRQRGSAAHYWLQAALCRRQAMALRQADGGLAP